MDSLRPGKDGNSMKCDQKLIRSAETLMQISTKFVLKCRESAQSIGGHEMTEFQWSVTKSSWGLGIPLIRISTKFEANPMNSMSRNVQKLNAWQTDEWTYVNLKAFCDVDSSYNYFGISGT